MLRSGKVRVAIATAGVVLAVSGIAALPNAAAADCTVVVTLVSGQRLYFQLAQGEPVSSLSLPAGVSNISESCPPAAPTASSSSGSGSSSSSSTTSTSSGPPHTSGPGSSQQNSSHGSPPPPPGSPASHPSGGKPPSAPPSAPKSSAPPPAPAPPPPTTASGIPTASNPTFSFATPGPAVVGVPNFFIDNFRIPPFLLPIYQAAGIEYDIPWQVLAAINEIETDYGRNLSVSSAGAVGWMQFLPSTWKEWGVDATGTGYADPYNPVDAVFAAARYLHAAGGSKNISGAIYAYNHASWYVQSVLLRAKLIGGMPNALIGALSGLVEGHFPVAAKAKYADDTAAHPVKVSNGNPTVTVNSDPASTGTKIYANQNSPVIAVNDGKILKVGQSPQLGKYLELQDETGNVYTYSNLGSIPSVYPVPIPMRITASQIAKELSLPNPANTPATAGQQGVTPTPSAAQAAAELKGSQISLPVTQQTASSASQLQTGMVKERLFADPYRPASWAAGGDLQVQHSNAASSLSNFQNYFADVLHLGPGQYTLQPLRAGSRVVAGTIIGRIGAGTPTNASHVLFSIRPAGSNAPYIDPKPILDGWKLLEATAIYRAEGLNPFVHKSPTIGQILLMSKEQLESRVLSDPHVQIYSCGRRDIEAGLVDRRILSLMEFLSGSGLDPTVSGLVCGNSSNGQTGVDAAGATGASIDISKVNNIPVLGHQGAGSITDQTIRRLLTLQGTYAPAEIISTMSYKNQQTTINLPDHNNRIQVTYTTQYGPNNKLSNELKAILQPGQWIQLINRISQLPEPVVPITPSQYAIKTNSGP